MEQVSSVRNGTVSIWPSEIFVGTLAVCIAGLMLVLALKPTNFERRMRDFSEIRAALEAYHRDEGRYPEGTGSALTAAGVHNDQWIIGLVPNYMGHIPQDPRLSRQANLQYVYISNGADYKFIAHAPEDFEYVRPRRPDLVDPRRPDYAYGIWTEGAAKW